MLDIINSLGVFFEDCYREIGVREYARETKISAPAASARLKNFEKQGLLRMREDRGYLLFRANRESIILQKLSAIYWSYLLEDLIHHLTEELYAETVVLFGSLSKLEATKDSDIDLAVFGKIKKETNLKKFEKVLKREIQVFKFDSLGKVNKELKTNILNGVIMKGRFS